MKRDWDIVTSYIDNVGTSDKTVLFPKAQESVKVTNKGNTNLIYTIGTKSGTLTPSGSVTVNESLTSFTVQAATGKTEYEVRASEAGTEQEESTPILPDDVAGKLEELESTVAQLATQVGEGGGGGGTLTVESLSSLQSLYPTGLSVPVWVTSENKWYYWNGTAPTDATAPILTITAGGTFTGTKSVTMSTNETATIYYTLDGSTPTTSSGVYSSALSITATTTLKAFAKDTAGNSSANQTVTYTLDTGGGDTTAPVLTITPATTFADTQTVNMSTNETATIWYTLDDSDPITSGTRLQYTAPLTLTETDTIKAYAVDSANNASAVQTVTYTKSNAIVSDSFNRADSTSSLGVAETGQTWEAISGTWGIQSNAAYRVAGTNALVAINSGYADNIAISAKVTQNSGAERIAFRISDANNYMYIQQSLTTLRLYKYEAGVSSQLSSMTVDTLLVGDILKVVLTAGQIEVYRNDTKHITSAETFNNTSTKHGFVGTSTVGFDDFKVEAV
jgi:hypothetical protein